MHARDIYNVLIQGRTVQKGGSNPQTPGKSHPVFTTIIIIRILRPNVTNSFHLIQTISIAPLRVHFYSKALPTQHGYCAGV